ncbi:M48 family metallopeptidase [Sphingomonas sp. S1-29]|uniref:M48 family metallopeptidase n=1 Tax=Sphingomonas sp. S1-29 TaxID=2991074 RepID=UPI0022401AFD|nr:M48 family metallopeptidase [Sphingomonas sp. S1-29]UZK69915.1 M48 family metallopeptidase [Sphingomonas sp. S1-29]
MRLPLLPAAIAISTMLPCVPAAAQGERFQQLRAQDLRVASVAYRLAVSGSALCPTATEPQSGIVLHSLAQYAEGDRAAAAEHLGLGDGVTVLGVTAGSAADRAGLSAKDVVLSIGGAVLVDATPSSAARLLADALAQGATTIVVARGGGNRELRLAAERGCPTRAELLTDTRVNAWADGERVMLTTGIVAETQTDDELAIVIAHEMAHNILRHRSQLGASAAQSALLPGAGSPAAMQAARETEEEADRFAVGIAGAAGYDLAQAAPFLERLLVKGGIAQAAADTHPAGERRIALLTAAVAEATGQSAQR